MMDWRSLAFNGLWIVAAALALAALSHAGWAAGQRGEKFPQALARAGSQRVLVLAGVLFCLGQAGSAQETWLLAAWLVLAALLAALQAWRYWAK